jgi:Undecaprenyl-phosphate galactose phosphotransferase WbaP
MRVEAMAAEGPFSRRHRADQIAFVGLLLASDVIAIFLSFSASYALRRAMPGLSPLAHGFNVYLGAGAALGLWPLMFSQLGLYPAYWLTSHDELRRLATGTTLASLLAVALTFVTQTGLIYSRPILAGGWLLSLMSLPTGRFLVRRAATGLHLSGPPAVILGAGETAAAAVAWLRRQHPPALQPVAVFDPAPAAIATNVAGVPVLGSLDTAPAWAVSRGIRTAIIASPQVPRSSLLVLLDGDPAAFPHIVVLTDLLGISGPDVEAHDLQGVLALELRRNLLSPRNLALKRLLDLTLLAAGSVLALPLAAVISLAILVESGRPAIFGHPRIGRGGAPFTAWKFRTMVGDAEAAIDRTVLEQPALREEWASRRKLRADPRTTRVGRLLRRTSLDELPQLWNVLRGEMSLVGPRPIVAEEMPRYGEAFKIYAQVPPGLSGLWQVSGRSDTSYADRVALDTHYVRSWSIWMDLVILVRTVGVVLARTGAY